MRFQSPPSILNQAVIVANNLTISVGTHFAVQNLYSDGMLVYFNLQTCPGVSSTSVALKVRIVDPVNGNFIKIAQIPTSNALSATGMQILSVNPFLNSASASTFVNVPFMVPKDMDFLVSLSSAAAVKKVVFSLGIHFTIS